MKRIISWMLVLFMGLSLVPAGFAEEFFAEEAFADAPAGDENVFFEEGLFGDAAFFAAENAEEAPAAEEEEISLGEIEARSIVSFVTDQVEAICDPDGNVLTLATEASTPAELLAWTEHGYWKVKPTLEVKQGKNTNQIVLSWTQDASSSSMGIIATKTDKTGMPTAKGAPTKFPKTVKYYIYAVNTQTGAAFQVGKPVAVKFNKTANTFGNTVTLNKMDGDFSYFVRAENLVVGDKKLSLSKEEYGISSDIKSCTAIDAAWEAAVKSLKVTQLGEVIEAKWTATAQNLDGFQIFDQIDGTSGITQIFTMDKLDVDGTSYSVRLTPPADMIQDKLAYTVVVKPYRKINGEDKFGKAATKKIKLVKDSWKTVNDLTVEEIQGTNANGAAVRFEWTVEAKDLRNGEIIYTLGGLTGSAKLKVSVNGDTSNAEAVDNKNYTMSSYMAKLDGETVTVTVEAMAKLGSPAKVTVQPAQGKTKGTKVQAEVNVASLKKPVILSGAQTGDGLVTIRFNPTDVLTKDQTFVFTGFAGKDEIKWSGYETGFNNENAIYNEEEGYVEYTGKAKAVKKATKVKFAVQSKMGKKASKKSDNFEVTVRPANIATAMNITFEALDAAAKKLPISFTVLQDKANIEKINISLVKGELNQAADFTDKTNAKLITINGADLQIVDNKVTVTFDGVEQGNLYTAFVEVILTTGRLVDSASSVAGKQIKNPDSEKKPEVDSIKTFLEAGNGNTYDGKPIFVFDDGEKLDLGDLSAKLGLAADEWKYELNGAEWKTYNGGIDKAEFRDGENTLRFRNVISGVDGKISDPVTVIVYGAVKIVDFRGPASAWNIAKLTAFVEGGSGEFEVKVNDDVVTDLEEIKVKVTGDDGTENVFTLTVTDKHIEGQKAKATGSVKVTKSKKAEDGAFTYEISTITGDKLVQVVHYNRDKYEDSANKNSPTVPATATIEDAEYKVVEIGANAFLNDTELTGITLPNAIEVIGESAFSGCTSLANMTCY